MRISSIICAVLLCLLVQGRIHAASKYEASGSFVSASTEVFGGKYSAVSVVEGKSAAGDQTAERYSSASSSVKLANNRPEATSATLILSGRANAIQTISYAQLTNAIGASDVDGDPIVFRLHSLSGMLDKAAGKTNVVEVRDGETVVWNPPGLVNGKDKFIQVYVSDGLFDAETVSAYEGRFSPAVFWQPASNLVASAAGVATATVLVSGSEPLAYQWTKNGQPLSGQTNSTLQLASLGRGSEGVYELSAQNQFGSTNGAPVVLRVLVPQKLVMKTAADAGSLSLAYADFDGNPAPSNALGGFVVEWSSDLKTWHRSESAGVQSQTGVLELLVTNAVSRRFYRVLSK